MAILGSLIFNVDIIHFETSSALINFDFGMWKIILQFTASLLAFTTLSNALPLGPIARSKRDAQFDTLEKYGLAANYIVAAGTLLISIGGGCVEVFVYL